MKHIIVNMKHWAILSLKIFISLAVFFALVFFIFVKWTLSETSIDILEEKLANSYDPYTTIYSKVLFEEGSIVKKDELKHFYVLSAEKNPFQDFWSERIEEKSLYVLEQSPEQVQVNRSITFSNLLQNDCKEVYCYQHYLPFEYIPSIFWKGLISVEDKRYLDHFGVDFKSIFRAFIANIKKMRFEQGGSTISQQLVKNLFFTNEKTFTRKLKEVVVSIYVENKFPKEKILEAYLNEVYWGALQGIKIKGVFAASVFYFGKKPRDITPYEGAVLIGLLKGPSYFSPVRNLERLKERTKVVFEKLIQENVIPDDKSLIWKSADWAAFEKRLKAEEKNLYFNSLWKTLNDKDPALGNYEKFVLIQKIANLYNSLKDRFKDKLDTKEVSVKVLVGDVTTKETFSYYTRVERNKEKAFKEEAHQVGSAIKPIIYSIFQDLGKSLADYVLTSEVKLKLPSGQWSPKEAHKIEAEMVTLSEALLKSYNRPVIRIAEELGFDLVEEKLLTYFPNLKKPLREYPSELLGSMELSVSNFWSIYAKFIIDECAKIKNSEKFLDQSVLSLLSDPNQTTVEKSVSQLMQNLRFFGKTGTTNNGYDNWYVAFDGKYLSIIWVGYEGERQKKSLGLYGATTAFNIYQNYYRDRGRRFQQFGCEVVNN